MSTKTLEFKFIHYEPLYSNVEEIYADFYDTMEKFHELGEDNVTARVLAYYYEGMVYVISADQYFKSKNYEKALENYETGHKLIVRSRASRGREGDAIFYEMVKCSSYAEAFINICKTKLEKEVHKKLEHLTLAIENLQIYMKERERENNKIDSIIAQARTSYGMYLYNYNKARIQKQTTLVKKYLLKARAELMKAQFIFKSYEEELEDLRNLIDDLTKSHIIQRAEKFWDKGSLHIGNSNFHKAQDFFSMASQYYERASQICDEFMEMRLYLALSKITNGSKLEAKAIDLYRRQDQPIKASNLFKKAYESVDESLGLLVSIKNEALIKNMTAQRSYYEALALETQGINYFDNEDYAEAKEIFEQAMKKLEETDSHADEIDATDLKEYTRKAKNEIEGYLSMSKDLI